jgi:hypothetical protein
VPKKRIVPALRVRIIPGWIRRDFRTTRPRSRKIGWARTKTKHRAEPLRRQVVVCNPAQADAGGARYRRRGSQTYRRSPEILEESAMNMIVLLIVLLVLFGGGGFYVGGPLIGGGLGGLILLVLVVMLLTGRL